MTLQSCARRDALMNDNWLFYKAFVDSARADYHDNRAHGCAESLYNPDDSHVIPSMIWCFPLPDTPGIAMPAQIKITKRTVDRITGDGSDRFYWDDDLPGFGLRVRASGRKYYVVQFAPTGGCADDPGPPWGVTPETARRRAMALISEAKGGKDPAALRDKGRKAATMKVLGKRFLEEYVPVHCKPSTAYEYRRSVKFFIDPRIGTRKVTEIQRSDIAELHHGMRETPYQANRTLGVLSKMFNLAELWGLRPDGSNPCLHVKRYKEEKRERFLNAEEASPGPLGRVLDEILACRSRRGELGDPLGGSRNPWVIASPDADRLPAVGGDPEAALGACRSRRGRASASPTPRRISQVAGARFRWRPPPSIGLLTGSLPRPDEDNPWVIAGRKPRLAPPATDGCSTSQMALRGAIGRRGRDGGVDSTAVIDIHDLRHSFASRALALRPGTQCGEGLPIFDRQIAGRDYTRRSRRLPDYAHLSARDTRQGIRRQRIGDSRIDRDLDAAE